MNQLDQRNCDDQTKRLHWIYHSGHTLRLTSMIPITRGFKTKKKKINKLPQTKNVDQKMITSIVYQH